MSIKSDFDARGAARDKNGSSPYDPLRSSSDPLRSTAFFQREYLGHLAENVLPEVHAIMNTAIDPRGLSVIDLLHRDQAIALQNVIQSKLKP